jgi:hypothetical protein
MPNHRRSTILVAALLTTVLSAAGCTAGPSSSTDLAPVPAFSGGPASPVADASPAVTTAPPSNAAPTSRAVISTVPGGRRHRRVGDRPGRRTHRLRHPERGGDDQPGRRGSPPVSSPRTGPPGRPASRWATGARTGSRPPPGTPPGRPTSNSSSFTTVTPAGVIFPSFEPPPDRGTVGVGQRLHRGHRLAARVKDGPGLRSVRHQHPLPPAS